MTQLLRILLSLMLGIAFPIEVLALKATDYLFPEMGEVQTTTTSFSFGVKSGAIYGGTASKANNPNPDRTHTSQWCWVFNPGDKLYVSAPANGRISQVLIHMSNSNFAGNASFTFGANPFHNNTALYNSSHVITQGQAEYIFTPSSTDEARSFALVFSDSSAQSVIDCIYVIWNELEIPAESELTTLRWSFTDVDYPAGTDYQGANINTLLTTSPSNHGSWRAVHPNSVATDVGGSGTDAGIILGAGNYPFNGGTLTLRNSNIPENAIIAKIKVNVQFQSRYNIVSAQIGSNSDVASLFCENDNPQTSKTYTSYTNNATIGSSADQVVLTVYIPSGQFILFYIDLLYYIPQQETVATPSISPDGGEIAQDEKITITTTTDGALLHYQWDEGDEVNCNASTAQISPVNGTLKVWATKDGMLQSDVSTAIFTITSTSVPDTTTFSAISNYSQINFANPFILAATDPVTENTYVMSLESGPDGSGMSAIQVPVYENGALKNLPSEAARLTLVPVEGSNAEFNIAKSTPAPVSSPKLRETPAQLFLYMPQQESLAWSSTQRSPFTINNSGAIETPESGLGQIQLSQLPSGAFKFNNSAQELTPVKIYSGGGTPTGLQEVTRSTISEPGPWYNLQGIQVSRDTPLPAGIYLHKDSSGKVTKTLIR